MTEMFNKQPDWGTPKSTGWGATQSVAPMTPYQKKPKTPSSAPQTPQQKTGIAGLLQNKRVKTALVLGGGVFAIALISIFLLSLRKKKNTSSSDSGKNYVPETPVETKPAKPAIKKPDVKPNPSVKPQVPTKPTQPSKIQDNLPSVYDIDTEDEEEEPELTEVTPVKIVDITPSRLPAPDTPQEVSEDDTSDQDDEDDELASTADFLNDIGSDDDEDVVINQ